MSLRMLFYLPGCMLFIVLGCEEKTSLTLVNPSGNTLEDQPVVLQRSDLPERSSGEVLLLKGQNSQAIPTQYDDLDGDGTWDELVFQYALEPQEKATLEYEWVSSQALPDFQPRAHVHLGYSADRNNVFQSVTFNVRPRDHEPQSTPYLYQFEGPGWESEVVAFRSYFDSRNGKDIFGKTERQLYVDSMGLGENYHSLQPWGMDVLKVGSSLGAGALALLKNDSLYRLGETAQARFEVLADGPVRARLKLSYEGWAVGDQAFGLEETITIWGGKRWYESEVRLIGGTATDTLVTGIVDLHDLANIEKTMDGWKIMYTHGQQSENKDNLGMALLVPEAHSAGFGEAPKSGNGVTHTYLAYLLPDQGVYRFLFYAGWEGEHLSFADGQYFESQLEAEVEQWDQSIETNFEE